MSKRSTVLLRNVCWLGHVCHQILLAALVVALTSSTAYAQDHTQPNTGMSQEILNNAAFANAAFERGTELLQARNISTAITMLELAIDREPQSLLYRQTLAEAYLTTQTESGVSMALDQFTSIIKQQPENREAMAGLVQSAILLDQPALAIDTLESHLLVNGTPDMSLLTDLSALYLATNMLDRGIKTLTDTLPKVKNPVAIELMLANFYQLKGDMDSAKAKLESASTHADPGSGAAQMVTDLKTRWGIE